MLKKHHSNYLNIYYYNIKFGVKKEPSLFGVVKFIGLMALILFILFILQNPCMLLFGLLILFMLLLYPKSILIVLLSKLYERILLFNKQLFNNDAFNIELFNCELFSSESFNIWVFANIFWYV